MACIFAHVVGSGHNGFPIECRVGRSIIIYMFTQVSVLKITPVYVGGIQYQLFLNMTIALHNSFIVFIDLPVQNPLRQMPLSCLFLPLNVTAVFCLEKTEKANIFAALNTNISIFDDFSRIAMLFKLHRFIGLKKKQNARLVEISCKRCHPHFDFNHSLYHLPRFYTSLTYMGYVPQNLVSVSKGISYNEILKSKSARKPPRNDIQFISPGRQPGQQTATI